MKKRFITTGPYGFVNVRVLLINLYCYFKAIQLLFFSVLYRSNTAVDGGWSAWSSWYGCTVACDGIQVRVRTCDSPFPSPNGAPCNGSAVQDEACDSTNCQPSSGILHKP